jgi:hypothetical protein
MGVLRSPTARSFLGGVLAANSLAHLATAVTGREHLTPLAGRTSGPVVNAVWGGANLLGGLLLTRSAGGPGRRWDERLVAFDAGAAAFAAWMALSEGLMRVNSGVSRGSDAGPPASSRA